MGDMFSSKKTSTSQTTSNEQVAQQGSGQVGRVTGSGNTIQITDASDVSLYAQRDTALGALREMGQASVAASAAAMHASDVNGAIAARSFDTADNALAVSQGVVNASYQSVIQTLGALTDVQKNANETTQMAVAAAQETALRATPVSEGAMAEILGDQQSKQNKQLIVALVLIVGAGVGFYLVTRAKP